MTIRILIADDQHLVRSGFRMILESEDGLEVVAEAANGQEAVSAARRLRPDPPGVNLLLVEITGYGPA